MKRANPATNGRVIIASNRGPVMPRHDGSTVRGAGGLVTALNAVARLNRDSVWVVSADPGEAASEVESEGTRVFFVEHDREDYTLMYNSLANPVLWFVQHGLYSLPLAPDFGAETRRAWEGYLAVNRNFAATIAGAVAGDPSPTMLVHDYHLYMVPGYLRETLGEGAVISFFLHIPWPEPDLWRVLPAYIREETLKSLLKSDVVAFHTRRYADAFLATVRDVLGLEVHEERSSISLDGREVWVRAYPISIDPAEFEGLAASEVVGGEEGYVKGLPGKLLLRVDRMDLSKNIVRGFRAYGRMLERHPEMLGEVTFLAQLQPSRTGIPEYAAYAEEIVRVVGEINGLYGGSGWTPIVLAMQDNFPRSVAAYKNYDALLVNAVRDGMNLVAKEAVVVNETDGVLILSEGAGAYEELGEGAIVVNPFDLDEQADAIYEALTMPLEDRRKKAEILRDRVFSNTIRDWAEAQMSDIASHRRLTVREAGETSR